MARMESKSIEVSPKEEQSTIDTFGKFGWSLVSSQEIFNKDSHLERRGDTIQNVTETTNYVKLVFNRDKDMPYYDKVTELENSYYATLSRKPFYAKKSIWWLVVLTIVIPVFVVAPLVDNLPEILGYILFFAAIALGIFLIIVRKKKDKENEAVYDTQYAEWQKELSLIIADVENYV